jgi:hypothetical protein
MATINRPRTVNDPSFGASEEIFPIADTTLFLEYVAGDLDGAEGAIASYKSDTPGSQATIDLTDVGDIDPVSHCDFTDINVIGGIIYADDTCTGWDQNNDGIVFAGEPSTGAGGQQSMSLSLSMAI